MLKKLLWGIVFTATVFWGPGQGACRKSRCQIRSFYRHGVNHSHALLNVKLGSNGQPTAVQCIGQDSQRSITEFVIRKCVINSKLTVTIRWNSNRAYVLAVKSGNVVLETTSTITDSHRFVLGQVTNCPGNCVAFQSVSASQYIGTGQNGYLTLQTTNIDRGTWFMTQSCAFVN